MVNHHGSCPAAQAWDIPNVPCGCPQGWPRKSLRELTIVTPTRRKPKGPTARYRAKRRRAEAPVIKVVRADCVERDGECRICDWEKNPDDYQDDDMPYPEDDFSRGPSEWAHLESRARTRNMKPELRHTTATSAMLCKFHHDRLDGRARPRIRVTVQTGLGANGPLNWSTP